MNFRTPRIIGIAAAIVGLAMFLPLSASADETSELEAIREATEKYKDVNIALAAGFLPAPPVECVAAADLGLPPELGAVGIHYINPAMLKITATEPRVDGMSTHTDFLNPAILLYEPQAEARWFSLESRIWCFRKHGKRPGITPRRHLPDARGTPWPMMPRHPATKRTRSSHISTSMFGPSATTRMVR